MISIILSCSLFLYSWLQNGILAPHQRSLPVLLVLPGQKAPSAVNMVLRLDASGELGDGFVFKIRDSHWHGLLTRYPPEYRFVCCFGMADGVSIWSPILWWKTVTVGFQAIQANRRICICLRPWPSD